jgi:hypothetical protein
MASVQQLSEQVHGILSRNELQFSLNPDGTTFRIVYESTAAFVDVLQWGDGALVQVRSLVLENVDAKEDRELAILRRLNDENARGLFGSIWLDRDRGNVVLDHHLLGTDLQSAELMNALSTIVNRADALDDELSKEFGTGERWADVEARTQQEQSAGPPISA